MDIINRLGIGLGLLVLAFLLFLALREFWAWYFKTNELIKIQTEILEELKKSNRASKAAEAPPTK